MGAFFNMSGKLGRNMEHGTERKRTFANRSVWIVFLLVVCLFAGCKDAEKTVADQPEENVQTPVITVTETSEKEEHTETEETEQEAQEETLPDPDKEFYISEITDELFERMKGKSFKDDCTLPREDLRYVHVLHKTLDKETLEGELVVNVHIAEDVLAIFRELYEADYPIEKIRLIDEYDADDDLSMADNNTSCFNYRLVANTNHISKHGRGLAIDLNPLYNPYITTVNGVVNVSPQNGEPYADRDGDFPYKIDENDLAYRLFTERGFAWGGAWKNEKDYQHFEIPKDRIAQWYP